jgi:hypothetical protein
MWPVAHSGDRRRFATDRVILGLRFEHPDYRATTQLQAPTVASRHAAVCVASSSSASMPIVAIAADGPPQMLQPLP